MFNRSYQIRSRMQPAGSAVQEDLVPVREIVQELVERAAVRQRFYRPQRRVKPGAATNAAKDCKNRNQRLQGVQLELFANPVAPQVISVPVNDAARPLFDLFPEAYQ